MTTAHTRKINFHTHCTYCDGKSTLEENVISAISKGMQILGFSSHASFPLEYSCSIKLNQFQNYCSEVLALKEKYKNQIDIRLGFEADWAERFCKPDFEVYKKFNPDFLIGSVHFIDNGGSLLDDLIAIDYSPERRDEDIKKYFKGNAREYVCSYFETQRQMLKNSSFSIIGHPDLVRKINEKSPFFNEDESWYKEQLKETAKAIKKAGVISEINTGAISRKWLTSPYPSLYFLELLHDQGVPVMLSSDSHFKDALDCSFDIALNMAKKAGYKELCYPDNGTIKSFDISQF